MGTLEAAARLYASEALRDAARVRRLAWRRAIPKDAK